ncbi:MAG: hypothetical protein ACOZBL_01905 [Patescibacteria group bacterium]
MIRRLCKLLLFIAVGVAIFGLGYELLNSGNKWFEALAGIILIPFFAVPAVSRNDLNGVMDIINIALFSVIATLYGWGVCKLISRLRKTKCETQ